MNATTERPRTNHPPKKGKVVRARCEDSLPESLEAAARTVGFDAPDFIRFVLASNAEIVAKGGRAAFFRLYAAA